MISILKNGLFPKVTDRDGLSLTTAPFPILLIYIIPSIPTESTSELAFFGFQNNIVALTVNSSHPLTIRFR